MVIAPLPTHDSAVSHCFHGCLALLYRHFPPQSPPSHPLDPFLHSQQQPSPWDCSTIPKLQLPVTALSKVCISAARTAWFSFHLGCHRSAVLLSALNVSPLDQTIPQCGGQTPASVLPPSEGRSSPTNNLVSPPLLPSSCRALCGSIYSFLLVRYTYMLSAGVLQALLCLKVYSWCIHGERCIPCPPTPLPCKNRMYSQVAQLYTRLQNSGVAELRRERCPLSRLFFTTTTADLVQQKRWRALSFDITATN